MFVGLILFFGFLYFFQVNPALATVVLLVSLFIWFWVSVDNRDIRKDNLGLIRDHVNNKGKIEWNELFSDHVARNHTEINELILTGITDKLFTGELIHSSKVNSYVDTIKKQSLLISDSYAIEKGLSQYYFVDISRSTSDNIPTGTYFYNFSDEDDLVLLRAPINYTVDEEGVIYPVFDSDLLSEVITIKRENIKDFQYFGSQLMETSLSLGGQVGGPGTFISELLFGPSFAILKGINSLAIQNKHSINDARVVQVILDDKTDVEFSGISIFYEFNRRFGVIKNMENANFENEQNNDTTTRIDNIPEQLRAYRLLADEKIISEEEFETKKKQLLD